MLGRVDDDHLSWSSGDGRVLYSFNMADYCRIHDQWLSLGRRHGGIIVSAQQGISIGEQLRCLLRLIQRTSAEAMISRLEYLGDWKG